MTVTRIYIALDRLTTIRFPSPLSDLQSALVAAEPHPDALFLVVFQPGNAFFSLRALAPNASTTLNVVWNNQTCVLELVESPTPCLSAIFEPPPEPAPTNRHARVLSAIQPSTPVPTAPPPLAPSQPTDGEGATATPTTLPVLAPARTTNLVGYKWMLGTNWPGDQASNNPCRWQLVRDPTGAPIPSAPPAPRPATNSPYESLPAPAPATIPAVPSS